MKSSAEPEYLKLNVNAYFFFLSAEIFCILCLLVILCLLKVLLGERQKVTLDVQGYI